MSKIGNFVMELQEQGALLSNGYEVDLEPDFMDYARDYMATKEYAKAHDEQTQRSIESFLESVRGHGL
jgi:hypothetical protein